MRESEAPDPVSSPAQMSGIRRPRPGEPSAGREPASEPARPAAAPADGRRNAPWQSGLRATHLPCHRSNPGRGVSDSEQGPGVGGAHNIEARVNFKKKNPLENRSRRHMASRGDNDSDFANLMLPATRFPPWWGGGVPGEVPTGLLIILILFPPEGQGVAG